MKPIKGEIVKGVDLNGRTFSQGCVKDSSLDESRVRLEDGSDLYVRNEDIRPQVDFPGKKLF